MKEWLKHEQIAFGENNNLNMFSEIVRAEILLTALGHLLREENHQRWRVIEILENGELEAINYLTECEHCYHLFELKSSISYMASFKFWHLFDKCYTMPEHYNRSNPPNKIIGFNLELVKDNDFLRTQFSVAAYEDRFKNFLCSRPVC